MSYNSKSKKAEEFICHEEIEETLRYAEEHKNDVEDMRKILERAKDCKGLSYREAALLLECEDESIHQEILWQQDRAVRAAVSFKLLHQWL